LGGWYLSRIAPKDGLAVGLVFWSAGSILTGFVNCIPAKKGELRTDGYKVFDALRGSNFRRIQFAVCCSDFRKELVEAVGRKDVPRAKEISRIALGFGEGLPEDDKFSGMLNVLRRIVAQPDTDAVAVEDGSDALVKLAEA
jgi:hypothetical protein